MPQALGSEYVDRHTVASVAVCDAVGTDAVLLTAKLFETGGERRNRATRNPCVDDHVQVGRDARWCRAVFDAMEEDHLSADQRPLPRPHIAQFDQRVPQLVVVGRNRAQSLARANRDIASLQARLGDFDGVTDFADGLVALLAFITEKPTHDVDHSCLRRARRCHLRSREAGRHLCGEAGNDAVD